MNMVSNEKAKVHSKRSGWERHEGDNQQKWT